MANNETFEIKVQIKDDGSTATLTNIETKAKTSGVQVSLLAQRFKELQNAQAGSTTTLRMTSQEFDTFASSATGASKASGAAAASAMELGRVISDAPYGIRGMANNLSQLASNLLFMAQSTDKATGKVVGFGGALKGMFSALAGPLGILIAIQAVLAIMENFSSKLKKLEGDFKGLYKEGVTETTVRLELLERTLNDSNIAFETKSKMLSRAKEEFEELNGVSITYGETTAENINAIRVFREELEKTAMAKAVVELMEELTKKKVALMAGDTSELGFMAEIERWSTTIGLMWGGMGAGAAEAVGTAQAVSGELSEIDQMMEKYREFMQGEGLLPYIFQGKDGGAGSKRAAKMFKHFFLDLTAEINKAVNDRKSIGVTDPLKLLGFAEEEAQQALLAKFDNMQAKIDEKAAEYKEKLEKGIITETEYSEGIQKLQESTWQNTLELDAAMGELLLTQKAQRKQQELELEQQAARDLMAALASQDQVMAEREMSLMVNENDRLAREREEVVNQFNYKAMALQDEINLKKEAGLSTDALDQEMFTLAHERELALTDIKKQEAENRIETASHFGAAMGAISDLLGEQTQAGKIFGIAAATIDTYVAGAKVMADESIPSTPARIAAMIAVIARGLANVKKIMEVKVPGKGNTGGGGATTFNPNFNVVGNSGQNRLAETVAGAANEGTRAYVVYSDIQEAGAIEANAVQSASFG